MKTLKSIFVAVFAMVFTFNVHANTNEANEVDPMVVKFRNADKAMTFDILMNHLDGDYAELKLVDQGKNVLWDDRVEATAGTYAKRINVKNLVNGSYNLVISDSKKELIQPIKVTDKGVEIEQDKRVTVYFPEFNVKRQSVTISMRQNRVADAKISFATSEGEVFFKDKAYSAAVRKKYDTSNLTAGDYLVIIETPFTKYTKTFTVQ